MYYHSSFILNETFFVHSKGVKMVWILDRSPRRDSKRLIAPEAFTRIEHVKSLSQDMSQIGWTSGLRAAEYHECSSNISMCSLQVSNFQGQWRLPDYLNGTGLCCAPTCIVHHGAHRGPLSVRSGRGSPPTLTPNIRQVVHKGTNT